MLAHYTDKVPHEREGDANILAVGCGHLRELGLSRVVTQVRPHRFFAFDQDANSLAEVERCFGSLGVSLDRRNVSDIVSMQHGGLEAFDVESLRRHYARTLDIWAENFEARAAEAKSLVDDEKFRIWRVYLAGCAYAFENDDV